MFCRILLKSVCIDNGQYCISGIIDFFKITIVSCKFMQFEIGLQKFKFTVSGNNNHCMIEPKQRKEHYNYYDDLCFIFVARTVAN